MKNVFRYIYDFDVKKHLEYNKDYSNLKHRLEEYSNFYYKTYHRTLNNLYQCQFIKIDTVNNDMNDCVDKV